MQEPICKALASISAPMPLAILGTMLFVFAGPIAWPIASDPDAARFTRRYLPLAWPGVRLIGFTAILIAVIAANLFAVFGSKLAARSVGLFRTGTPVIFGPARLAPTRLDPISSSKEDMQ